MRNERNAFLSRKKEISVNSIFIIQGYSQSQRTIDSFRNRTVYLESEDGELIELNLQEILKGQMSLTQATFKPSHKLSPNTTYNLKYSNQTYSEGQEMFQYNREKKIREKIHWRTTEVESVHNIYSNLEIKFDKTEVVHYGCGPSANAIFKINNNSESEVWYKTEVLNLTTNKKVIFYLTEWEGKLNVGHGMCAGAFTFNKKGNYKVRFTPMNIGGKSLPKTDWVSFESPFKYEKNPFDLE